MDNNTDLANRLDTLETKMDGVQETISEAKGTIKAGVIFMGLLNTLMLPIAVWLLASTVATREGNVAQDVKIQRLESVCQENQSFLAAPKSIAAKQNEPDTKPVKDKIRPAASSLAWRNEDEL